MSADYIKMDYFYDGSKHNKSRTDCNSCNGLTLLEGKISTSASALETKIIFNLLSLTAEIKENHFHLHTLILMLDWTFHARGQFGILVRLKLKFIWSILIYVESLHASWIFFLHQQQQNLGRRFGTSKMHLRPLKA